MSYGGRVEVLYLGIILFLLRFEIVSSCNRCSTKDHSTDGNCFFDLTSLKNTQITYLEKETHL